MTVPSYQVTFPGGDTNIVGNFEYRIPLVGPVTLALFADAGIDKLLFPSQLHLNSGRLDQLNQEFPQAGFTGTAYIQPGSQKLRSSVGLELQVLMPVVNAPFRVYWAYNPNRFEGNAAGAGSGRQVVLPEHCYLSERDQRDWSRIAV